MKGIQVPGELQERRGPALEQGLWRHSKGKWLRAHGGKV